MDIGKSYRHYPRGRYWRAEILTRPRWGEPVIVTIDGWDRAAIWGPDRTTGWGPGLVALIRRDVEWIMRDVLESPERWLVYRTEEGGEDDHNDGEDEDDYDPDRPSGIPVRQEYALPWGSKGRRYAGSRIPADRGRKGGAGAGTGCPPRAGAGGRAQRLH